MGLCKIWECVFCVLSLGNVGIISVDSSFRGFFGVLSPRFWSFSGKMLAVGVVFGAGIIRFVGFTVFFLTIFQLMVASSEY